MLSFEIVYLINVHVCGIGPNAKKAFKRLTKGRENGKIEKQNSEIEKQTFDKQ